MKQAVVLVSGGLDQATVLAIAASHGFPRHAFSVLAEVGGDGFAAARIPDPTRSQPATL